MHSASHCSAGSRCRFGSHSEQLIWAIRLAEGFDAEGTLEDRTNLARAYLYGAIVYANIGDTFDRYALSNRQEAAPAIAPMEMDQFYRTAIDYLTSGLTVAEAEEADDLILTMTALRAGVYHRLGIWMKLNPEGDVPAEPLVQSAEAVADAMAPLDMIPEPDWKYQLDPANEDVAIAFEVSLPYNINRRKELQIGSQYVATDADSDITDVVLLDPIDEIEDPVLAARVDDFRGGTVLVPYTVVSAREMYLILAEDALARGDQGAFTTYINQLRALNPTLSPYTGAELSARELLIHERRVNLFLQTRRLSDLYRFSIRPPLWQDPSAAVQIPGTLFPITITECRGNPEIGQSGCGT